MLSVVQTLPEEKWRRFVDEHPQGNVFHTPEMFRVFARTKGHRPSLWTVVENTRGSDQVLALMLPVLITLPDGLLPCFTTRAVVYGSVLVAPGPTGREALGMLLQTYRRKARTTALFTELRNLSDLSELQPILEKNGFVYEEHLNYLIDLNRPSDEILQSVGRSTRKKIRKTLRDNLVQIIEVKNRVELEPCYETLQKTFSRAKVPLADYSLFAAACEELSPKGMARSLLAKVEGVIAACSIELAYKDVIYGWYGGSDRAYRRISLNEILIWHVLKWGADGDYRLYDFGGAGKPDEKYGVRDFKAKFGGKLVCFGRNRWVHYPALLRLSELGYYIYRCCLKQSQWLCRKRTDA